jgi:hypothetical protein
VPKRWLLALLSGALVGLLVGLLFGALAFYEHEVVSTRASTLDLPVADCVARPDCIPEARAFPGPADLPCCRELQ